jgi:hypothetical protein
MAEAARAYHECSGVALAMENRTMMDLRPAIRMFALLAAQKTLAERGEPSDSETAKAYVAEHPELLREAELQLRRAPGVRQIAKQWRANAEAELRAKRRTRQ